MTGSLDERSAWRLVLAAGPSLAGGGRVHLDGGGDPWLQVEADGGWTTSPPPTDAARDVLDIYLPLRLGAGLVIGQLGQSVDGRIATESGASHFVTGPEDIERLHRLRALVDAVVVGAGTVASDDPQLTVRGVEGENPVRVVLDPEGRLDPERRVFTDGASRTLAVRGVAEAKGAYEVRGEELFVGVLETGALDLTALLEALRSEGLHRVLVEGGGVTVSGFLRAGLLDRLHIAVAPVLIGSGRPSIILEPIESLSDVLRPSCRHFRLGNDVLFDLDFRSGPE